jgi:5-methylcytosine-specific restriction protein A
VGGRLKMLAPRAAALPGRLRWGDLAEGRAGGPWRRWYSTARWRALRAEVLIDAAFVCAMCRRVEGDSAQLVCDHIVPHRGDAGLFWDRANLQCLCKPCHDSAKQRAEGQGGV